MEIADGRIKFQISPKELIKVKSWVWKSVFTLFSDISGPNFPWFQFISGQLWLWSSDIGRIGCNINVWLIQCFVILYAIPTYSTVSSTRIHYSWIYTNRVLCIIVNVLFMPLWAWDAGWGVGKMNWNDFLSSWTL